MAVLRQRWITCNDLPCERSATTSTKLLHSSVSHSRRHIRIIEARRNFLHFPLRAEVASSFRKRKLVCSCLGRMGRRGSLFNVTAKMNVRPVFEAVYSEAVKISDIIKV